MRLHNGDCTMNWRGRFLLEWHIGGEVFHDVAHNQLYDQGEQDVLEGFFRNATLPADFKIGLLKNSYVINETHTMTQVAASELANAADGGYSARLTVARSAVGWPISALDVDGDWHITSAQVQWTATGAWTDIAGFMFLMADGTTAPGNTTGRVLAVAPLSPQRQLQAVNDLLKVQYDLKLR